MVPVWSLALMMWIPTTHAPDPDVRATLARFEQECLGRGGAPCEVLQAQLERALYRELMVMYLGGKDPDHRLLQVAARAQLPDLAAFGLRHLAQWRSAEDSSLAASGLDSPYPAVRSAAGELAQAINTPQLQRLANRSRNAPGATGTGLVPMEVPDARRLRGSVYPGSRYSFAASRRDLAVFGTQDASDKVIAFYAKGRRVLTGTELRELRKEKGGRKNDEAATQAMMKAVMSGQDPQAVMQEMMKSSQAQNMDWTAEIEGVQDISSPRYVVMEESGPRKVPSLVIAVYRDEALGATAVAFRLTPPVPDLKGLGKTPRVDPNYIQALHELQMRRD